MRIAFFGLHSSFGHYTIGGTDSIARRLAYNLVAKGHQVDFVTFGVAKKKTSKGEKGVSVLEYINYNDALQTLKNNYDDVLTIYLPPKERFLYGLFRWRERKKMRFHALIQPWPESRMKRELMFAMPRLFPYNGSLFSVSPRLHRQVFQWNKRARLFWPPVPDNFFLTVDEKPSSDNLRVTYMGRLDPGKGTGVAIKFFRHLAAQYSDIQVGIYGYPWPEDPATQRLHEELLAQDAIAYHPSDYKGYTPVIDNQIREILRNTDVLFLPYVKLSSTIDTPLVMLEGMAHLCTVITRPLGDLPFIYGHSEYMFEDLDDFGEMETIILKIRQNLDQERRRIYDHNETLRFRSSNIADVFIDTLTE